MKNFLYWSKNASFKTNYDVGKNHCKIPQNNVAAAISLKEETKSLTLLEQCFPPLSATEAVKKYSEVDSRSRAAAVEIWPEQEIAMNRLLKEFVYRNQICTPNWPCFVSCTTSITCRVSPAHSEHVKFRSLIFYISANELQSQTGRALRKRFTCLRINHELLRTVTRQSVLQNSMFSSVRVWCFHLDNVGIHWSILSNRCAVSELWATVKCYRRANSQFEVIHRWRLSAGLRIQTSGTKYSPVRTVVRCH